MGGSFRRTITAHISFNMNSWVAILLAVIYLSGQGYGLQCHQCSTLTHTKCGDPFFFEGEADEDGNPIPRTTEFLLDCPARDDGNEYTLCRKMYQNVRGEERVTRSCGYIPYKEKADSCYSTVLEEYNTYVCTCEGDGCNGSSANGPATTLLAALIISATALAKFY